MPIDDDIQQAAAHWFAVQRRGPMSLEERQAFDDWRSHAVHQAALNGMHELWGEVSNLKAADIAPRQRRSRIDRRVIAALLVGGVLVGLSGGAWWGFDRSLAQTRVGEQRSEELADGSIVALNVVTKVRYGLSRRERVVYLESGEAAFSVRRDEERPFLVRTGDYEVRAVGTAFNIRNRGHDLEVAVKEGRVEVRRRSGGGRPRILSAGQRLRLVMSGQERLEAAAVTAVAPGAVDEWRQRVLSYEDAPVSRVIQDLNRFYARPLSVDPALGRRHVTLRLVVDDRPETLDRLAAVLGADIRPGREADRLAGRV